MNAWKAWKDLLQTPVTIPLWVAAIGYLCTMVTLSLLKP